MRQYCRPCLFANLSKIRQSANLTTWNELIMPAVTNRMHGVHLPKSIRYEDDPFRLLGLSPTATKSEIMGRVMERIRQEPEKMTVWRQAQAELFDPGRNAAHRFMRYLCSENWLKVGH